MISVFKAPVAYGFNCKIIINVAEVMGEITSIDSGNKTVMIGGISYTYSERLLNAENMKLEVGDKGIFKLDINGRLASFEKEIVNKVGYLIDIAKGSGLSGLRNVKLLTDKGNIEIAELGERVEIDGNICRTYDDIYNALSENGSMKRQIILYRKSGELISYIDTPKFTERKEDKNTSLQLIVSEKINAIRYYREIMTFSGKAVLSSSAIAFSVPSDESRIYEDNAYTIKPLSKLYNDNSYFIDGYGIGENCIYINTLVVYEDHAETYNEYWSPVLCVTNMSNVIYKDKEMVKLRGIYSESNNPTDFHAEASVLDKDGDGKCDVGVGDFIRFNLDSNGEIIHIQHIYNYRNNTISAAYANREYVHSSRFFGGWVYQKEKGAARISLTNPNDGQPGTLEVHNFSNCNNIYIYDTDKEKFYKSSYNDMMPYDISGSDCSKLFIYTRSSAPRIVIIYR